MIPQSIAAWDHQQWGVFIVVIAAGLLAAVLAKPAALLHADMRARHWTPPPGSTLVVHSWHDTADGNEVAEHVAPGPGSITSLREVGPGALQDVEPLVDDDIRAEVGAALDAVLENFRVAVEPSMRTARLWTLRGGESYAENALRALRITERTGEYPIVAAAGTG